MGGGGRNAQHGGSSGTPAGVECGHPYEKGGGGCVFARANTGGRRIRGGGAARVPRLTYIDRSTFRARKLRHSLVGRSAPKQSAKPCIRRVVASL